MPRKTARQIIDEALDSQRPKVRQAWKDAIQDLRDGVVIQRIAEALERGDVDGAIRSLGIEADAFGRFEVALLEAYNAGGQATVDNMPSLQDPSGAQLIFRWGVRNETAERALRQHSATMVQGVTQDTIEGLREVMTEGLAQGRNPRATALDIRGRRPIGTQDRSGGLIGLDREQIDTSRRYRHAMLNGDRVAMKRFIGVTDKMLATMSRRELKKALKGRGLELRHRGLDSVVLDALQGERAMTDAETNRVIGRYEDRALIDRTERVAENETQISLAQARHDAHRQQIENGKIEDRDVQKTWRKTARKDPREDHIALNGQTVRGLDTPFVEPDGVAIRFPHDPQSPVGSVIFCQCYMEYQIDFVGAAARRFRTN